MIRPADPILAFGLRAQAVAVKAQAACLSERDMLDLVEALLDWADGDVRARDAVREFLALCRHDVPCAGRFLQAHHEGCAPAVSLARTHQRALEIVPLDILETYAAPEG